MMRHDGYVSTNNMHTFLTTICTTAIYGPRRQDKEGRQGGESESDVGGNG